TQRVMKSSNPDAVRQGGSGRGALRPGQVERDLLRPGGGLAAAPDHEERAQGEAEGEGDDRAEEGEAEGVEDHAHEVEHRLLDLDPGHRLQRARDHLWAPETTVDPGREPV